MMTYLSKVLRHIHPLLIFVIGTAWKFVVKENRMKTNSFVSCFTVNFWNYIPKVRHNKSKKRNMTRHNIHSKHTRTKLTKPIKQVCQHALQRIYINILTCVNIVMEMHYANAWDEKNVLNLTTFIDQKFTYKINISEMLTKVKNYYRIIFFLKKIY